MVTCNTPDRCTRLENLYDYEVRHLTIRESTADEREPGGVGAFWATGKPMTAKQYVIVDDENNYLGGFGLVDGGDTREEAVFWAERWASKNGGHFVRPDGWEHVVGALADTDDS